MDKPMSDSIPVRLDRLERENRLWRRGSVVTIVGLLLLLICGAHHTNDDKDTRLDAGEVNILDGQGRTRITLGSTPNVPGRVVIRDELGAPKIHMSVNSSGLQYFMLDDRMKNCTLALRMHEN
jgi:hypothetical protein